MLPNTGIPTLAPGFAAVPPGHIATIVTSLEMLRPPSPLPIRQFPAGIALEPLERADPETYRTLFRAVGADWLWFSRLTLPDGALAAILADREVEKMSRFAGRAGISACWNWISASPAPASSPSSD